MRISDIIVESEHLDEISLAGAGRAVGNVIRGTSKVVQGAKGAWQGAKDAWDQGNQSDAYNKARAAVAGTPAPTRQAATAGTQPAPTLQPAAAASAQAVPQARSASVGVATAPSMPGAAAPATAPATRTSTYSSKAAKAEVDQMVGKIQKIRSRDRQRVVQYAQQKLSTVKEGGDFYSNFLGKKI